MTTHTYTHKLKSIIWTENLEADGENAFEIAANNIKKISILLDLFPKNSDPNQKKKPETEEQENKETNLYKFQGCRNFEELKEKVKEFYQAHQTEIKQTSEFSMEKFFSAET